MGGGASRERELLTWSKDQVASGVREFGFGQASETVSSALFARGVDGRVLVDLIKMEDLSLENWCSGFETAAQRRDVRIFFRILGKLKGKRKEPPDRALVDNSDSSTVHKTPINSRRKDVSESPLDDENRLESTNSTSSNSPSSGGKDGGGRRKSSAASSAMGFESCTDVEAYTDSLVNSSVVSGSVGSSDKGTPPSSPVRDGFIDLGDDDDEVARKRHADALTAIATIDAAVKKDTLEKDKGGMPPTINMVRPSATSVPDTAMRAHATSQRERRNQPFPTFGVKVSWLRVFINENGGMKRFQGMTTGDVCNEIIRPAVLRRNITYAQLIKETQPVVPDGVMATPVKKKKAEDKESDSDDDTDSEDGNVEDKVLKQNVDEAQVMISHSWRNEFLATVTALENHFKDQPELHLWIDLFSMDQTYTTQPLPPAVDGAAPPALAGIEFQTSTHGMDYKWWSLTYKSAIGHFGGVVMVMSPWKEPAVLSSTWNLFELYCSCTIPFTDFEIAMTKEDSDTFIDEMSNSHQPYFAMLNSKVDMLRSTTFHKSDKERMFEFVDKEVEGKFETVNRVCANKLKEWVMLTIESNVSARAEEAAAKMRHAAKIAGMTATMAAKANEKRAIVEKKNNSDKVMRKADMLQEQQKYDEALKLYNKCLVAYKEVEGEEGVNVASTYNNIGIVRFHSEGYDYEEVLDYFTKALNIKTKALGADHRNVASIYNNMAALYQKTEKFADALEHYRLALSIEKKELAAGGRSDDPINEEDEESEGDSPTQKLLHHRVTHDDVAQTHVHLAMIHFSMNNESEAMHAYQAAADTYLMAPKETAMEGDPSLNAELATVYFQMADLLQTKDDSEGALEFLEKSLKIQQKVLGSYHLDVAHTYNMIADVHFSNGDVEPCIANFQSAREIYELTGEAESADMAHLLSNLALAHEEVGNEQEALSLYEDALAVRMKLDEQVSSKLSPTHPEVKTRKLAIADIYGHMGMLLDEAGEQDDAMEMYEKALDLRKRYRMSKDDDAAVADILHNICIVNRTRGEYLEALKSYQKSLPILRKVLGGETYLEIADTYINIGLMYRKMKANYVELEPEGGQDADSDAHEEEKEAALTLKREDHTESNLRSALDWFQKGLKVKIRVQGEKHPSVGGTHTNIGNVHKLLGEHEKALKAYESDLKCSVRSFGAEHPHIKSIQVNIEKMKRVIKSKRAVEDLAKKAREKAEEAERMKILEENEESEYETDPEDNFTQGEPTVPSTPIGDTRTPLIGSTANTTPQHMSPKDSPESDAPPLAAGAPVTPQTPVAPDTPAPSFARPQTGNFAAAIAAGSTNAGVENEGDEATTRDANTGESSAQRMAGEETADEIRPSEETE